MEDLERMQTFVDSIESARHHSHVISKHHRLFQVFHDVALRYTELKSASPPSQDAEVETRIEMDAYLSALGFQSHSTLSVPAGSQNIVESSSIWLPTMLPTEIQPDVLEANKEPGSPSQLANWYSVSQQMMGLLDSDQLPF